jgi:hypothetical protein
LWFWNLTLDPGRRLSGGGGGVLLACVDSFPSDEKGLAFSCTGLSMEACASMESRALLGVAAPSSSPFPCTCTCTFSPPGLVVDLPFIHEEMSAATFSGRHP